MNIYWIFFYLINLINLSFLSAYQSGSVWPSFGGQTNYNNRATNISGPLTNATLWQFTTGISNQQDDYNIRPSAIIDANGLIL